METREYDVVVLNILITTTLDSADGFEQAADDPDAAAFSAVFREFAEERREVARRLQARVRELGATPDDDRSLKAGAHRRWLNLANAIRSGSDEDVVAEVRRGERQIEAAYEAALADDRLSDDTSSFIGEALACVKRGYGRAAETLLRMETRPERRERSWGAGVAP